MERIVIFDTTLRDGEQSPGATLVPDEKLEIARQLARMGVDVIEAGFPLSSPGDFEAVSRIAKEVRNASICGLAHADAAAIDQAWEALKGAADPRIHVFLSTSDIHLMHQLRKNKEEVMVQAVSMVKRARRYVSNVEFSPMDATRSDPEYVYHIVEAAIDAGATTVNIPDTVGYVMPLEFEALIRGVFERVRNIHKAVVSVHCHNDLGLAVANSLAAVRAGARQIECTINGIGERAGNCSLEEVVMALHTRKDFFSQFASQIDTTQISKISRMVSDYTGMIVQPNKAIVGANAFRHESGIHQDGVIKERTTYEIMDPRSIGLVSSELVLGKLSGRHAFRQHVAEMGYQLSEEDLGRAFLRFKELADKKKEVTDRDLEAVISDELRMSHEIYRLEQVQVSCGDHSIPTATVQLIAPDGNILSDAALGTGPVDAIYKAINRIVGVPNRLIEFSVKSVTEGIDAIGDVTIRIESEGRVYTGRGAATDIVVASAKAYMNALNKLLAAQPSYASKP
ncbi:MAG: 2-isopropylmalate synthase [Chloroflexi bacterium]|nr:2-isopropylmalate synthase [Chloroflexota bacterium]